MSMRLALEMFAGRSGVPSPSCSTHLVQKTSACSGLTPLFDRLSLLSCVLRLIGCAVFVLLLGRAYAAGAPSEDAGEGEETACCEGFNRYELALIAGALALMLGMDGKALSGRRALIAGFGRIGRMLAPRLKALAMDVWVMARSSEQRVWAEAMGCGALKFSDKAPKTDFVLNTVPERVLGEKELGPMGRPLLIELASAPGGFREEAVEKLKLKLVKAPGLPSKCCPTAAAEAIRDTIYNILEE